MDNNNQNSKLFVASLSFKIRDTDLAQIFSVAGTVVSAKVIMGPDGRSKGYGFVEMGDSQEAQQAITKLNNSEHFGRPIVVNIQKPQTERQARPSASY